VVTKAFHRLWLLPVLLLISVIGCSARRPVLYPNERLASVGSDVAEQDVDECMRRAENYVPRRGGDGEDVARSTAMGAGTGAAAGAVGGAIWGNPGRGAATGAASGATAGLLHGLFRKRQPSTAYKNFVARCLGEKGYEVIGWQ